MKDISWRGKKYLWSKSLEFLRFVAAPRKSGETFELAPGRGPRAGNDLARRVGRGGTPFSAAAVVAGGGLLGLEVAYSLHQLGLAVTVPARGTATCRSAMAVSRMTGVG